jgi:hypothetical protein
MILFKAETIVRESGVLEQNAIIKVILDKAINDKKVIIITG